jgi:hypothetical protein
MRKTFPLCLLLLALTLTAPAAFAAPPAAPAPAPAIAAPLDFFGTATGSCPTATLSTPAPSPAALDLFGALSCCRPECSTNSGCDKKCGVGLGSCVQVNSCCKQCICNQT